MHVSAFRDDAAFSMGEPEKLPKLRIFQVLIDVHEVFDIRQSVFNTVYSVRCLSCLRVKGSFQEAALIIFPSTPIKNTEDGMKRWLRRAKKRIIQNGTFSVDHSV
ncbi:hypothetical protein NQ317_005857 [Molorchus minor]|uniref:Uncharacterized protein n=1 Tax=Molorchus minor TaxID=1323400 RepID=A0ABQ9JAP0_9CUCU|nr:hypothetical protein NQ317_005857 [Molorchus minor]